MDKRRTKSDCVILASHSSIRQQLLKSAGIRVRTVNHQLDEAKFHAEKPAVEKPSAEKLAADLARRKAYSVMPLFPNQVIMAADQVLLWHGKPLAKVHNHAQAQERLWAMRGQSHILISAAAIIKNGVLEMVEQRVQIHMRCYSEAALKSYMDNIDDSVLDSVSCYQIEGLGAQLISKIEGDYFSALGLPLFDVLNILRKLGEIKT